MDEGFDAGEDGGAGNAGGGNIEASGAVAEQAAPMGEPAEAALDDPAAREHDEAFLAGFAHDDVVAHAVQVRPLLAALGGEGAVHDREPQARPCDLAGVQGGQRVAILDRRGHDRDGQQCPSASTSATRLRPSTPLAGS